MARKSGQELKKEIITKLGLKSSDLSVRYDGSYNISVKTWFPISKIEEITKKYESIDRDERTGEILCGGNTFVFVTYDYNLKLTEELTNAVKSLPVLNFGDNADNSTKYHFYTKELAKMLNIEERFAGKILTRNYALCEEIYSRKN